jgi:hypothetical protein
MLAGWLLAVVVGGTIGAAVGAILAFLGAQELFDRLNDIYAPLKDWALLAYNANNDDDIDKAAKKFAPAFATGFLTAIEFVVLIRSFGRAQRSYRKDFRDRDGLIQCGIALSKNAAIAESGRPTSPQRLHCRR